MLTARAAAAFLRLAKHLVSSAAGKGGKGGVAFRAVCTCFVLSFSGADNVRKSLWPSPVITGEVRRLGCSLQMCRRQGNKRKGRRLRIVAVKSEAGGGEDETGDNRANQSSQE